MLISNSRESKIVLVLKRIASEESFINILTKTYILIIINLYANFLLDGIRDRVSS